MHIRTNVEMSFIHIVVLAICPLLLVMSNANQALYYVLATSVCYLISSFVCWVFNRHLNNSLKIFIVALLSSLLVTIIDYAVSNYSILGLTKQDNSFFVVITTVILSADAVYLESKALTKNFFISLIRTVLVYIIITLLFAIVKEFLAYGTIFDKKIFKYNGYEFFDSITFELLWLGLLCFVSEYIFRFVTKKLDEKKITYQKFVKKIRNEKVFQYDNLRRQKLLISEINTNKIDGEKIEEIKEKESENELVEVEESEETQETTASSVPKKKKKNRRLKFSKETKVEKVYDRQKKEGK